MSFVPYGHKTLPPRIQALREASLAAVPRVSIERARLMTAAYKKYAGTYSGVLLRAHAFAYLMEHRTLCIAPGELIVGERGPAPAETPTYPEICCHTVEDFETMDSREKVFFRVGEEEKRIQQEEIIPYWKDICIRKIMLEKMTPAWIDSYEAGIFTEFMEQRSPGHTVADDKIYRLGIRGLLEKIDAARAALDPAAADYASRRDQLDAMAICGKGLCRLAERYAAYARELAEAEADPVRRQELLDIAAVCDRVPYNPPATFREALQAYWFCHLGIISELNTWDSYSPGRLDQHLWPFYEKETAAGTIDRDQALEYLMCFWVKFNNQPAPPKVGITLNESGTYTDFCNINVGGTKPDGTDGVNPVSYMLLETIDRMKLLQPSSNVQLSNTNDDDFLRAVVEVIKKGWGQPSMFNAEAVARELMNQGKSAEDAHQAGTSGCVEAGAFGKEAYILTGYFNLPKILELTLHDGLDPRTGKQLGLHTGMPATFEELMAAFRAQVEHFVAIKTQGNDVIEALYGEILPAPFMSLLTDDCIARGKDYHTGGARYNTSYIQGVGIGTLTDSMSAIRKFVFEENLLTLPQLVDVLDHNFEGNDVLRARMKNQTPRYGNGDDKTDALMVDLFNIYHDAIEGRPNVRGGQYHIDMLPTTCHVYFGSVTGALPEGRLAGLPVSEGISPVQGSDKDGPTGVIRSAARMPHDQTGGTLLNMKFTPALLKNESGLRSLMALIRAYFAMGGHHIQFNVVEADTLRDAQKHPEKHHGLIVRVAGYSDFFDHLNLGLQNEIIERTENMGF